MWNSSLSTCCLNCLEAWGLPYLLGGVSGISLKPSLFPSVEEEPRSHCGWEDTKTFLFCSLSIFHAEFLLLPHLISLRGLESTQGHTAGPRWAERSTGRLLLGDPWVWGKRQIHLMESPTFWAALTCWPSAFPVWGFITWFNIFSLSALSFCNSQNGCSLSLIHGAACDLGGFQNHAVGGLWACGRVCELCRTRIPQILDCFGQTRRDQRYWGNGLLTAQTPADYQFLFFPS